MSSTMAKICVFEADKEDDYKCWNQIIEKYFKNEPMLKASYHKLFSNAENSGIAVLYKCNEGLIIYPFIKRKVPDSTEYFDIISAYGYGGPYCSSGIFADQWNDFWMLFDEWCKENRIVSEVIKFGLLGNENCCFPGKIETVMNNVVRTLGLSAEDMYREYEHKVRKNVKRAEKYELSFELGQGEQKIEKFLEIYYGTMDRRNADQKYYFDKDFFGFIDSEMKNNSYFFFVYYKEIPISTELVLVSEENIYSYLGGTNPDYFDMRPNDYMKVKIIEWGTKNGYKNYILGGGHGSEDGIFRYKKAFAPNGIKKFKIGSRIVDTEGYKKICNQKGVDEDNNFIPAYRVE